MLPMSPSPRTHKSHESHKACRAVAWRRRAPFEPPLPTLENEDEDDLMGIATFCHLSFVICLRSPLPLTISAISNDSVHRETDARAGGNFVLRRQHHVFF